MKCKAIIIFDTSDLGAVNRLVEDGVIKKMTYQLLEEKTVNPQQFVRDIRHNNGARARRKPDGLRAPDCIVAIMQTRPDDSWYYQDVGIALEADYGFHKETVSPAMSILKKVRYVQAVSNGTYVLTDLGKNHNQNDPVPKE